jgi:hypothetical protein
MPDAMLAFMDIALQIGPQDVKHPFCHAGQGDATKSQWTTIRTLKFRPKTCAPELRSTWPPAANFLTPPASLLPLLFSG